MADQSKWHLSFSVVSKKASDKSVTFTGWVNITTDESGVPIVDHHGQWIPTAHLEKAVHKAFTARGGKGAAGDMHERIGVIDVVESFVITKAKREALGFGTGPEGWIVTARSSDPEVVKAVKSGAKLELSLRGLARSVTVTDQDLRDLASSGAL